MSYQIGRLIVQRRSMVTAKQGPAQAGPLADRPSSGDFNPRPTVTPSIPHPQLSMRMGIRRKITARTSG